MEFVFGLEDLRTLAVACAAGGGGKGGGNSATDYFMLLGEFTGYSAEELKGPAGKYFGVKKPAVLPGPTPRKYFGAAQKRIRHSA